VGDSVEVCGRTGPGPAKSEGRSGAHASQPSESEKGAGGHSYAKRIVLKNEAARHSRFALLKNEEDKRQSNRLRIRLASGNFSRTGPVLVQRTGKLNRNPLRKTRWKITFPVPTYPFPARREPSRRPTTRRFRSEIPRNLNSPHGKLNVLLVMRGRGTSMSIKRPDAWKRVRRMRHGVALNANTRD